MAIEFNHTIVWAHDSRASANFLARMLGLPGPAEWGPFQIVTTDNGVNIDFLDKDGEIRTQHYAFLVGEPEFDAIFGRIQERGLTFWADPARTREGGSMTMMVGAASISRTRTATFWRSSPVPMAAAAGIRDRRRSLKN
jgi:hypothetical protein